MENDNSFFVSQIKYNGEFYDWESPDTVPFFCLKDGNFIIKSSGTTHGDYPSIVGSPKVAFYGRIFYIMEEDIYILCFEEGESSINEAIARTFTKEIASYMGYDFNKVYYHFDFRKNTLEKLEGSNNQNSYAVWRDEIKQKKLGNMTMAQYHNLIYQEGIDKKRKNLLIEGKDRKQQARYKTRQIYQNEHMYDMDDENAKIFEQQIYKFFFHDQRMASEKDYFICLEPLMGQIALDSFYDIDENEPTEEMHRAKEILEYIYETYKLEDANVKQQILQNEIAKYTPEQFENAFGEKIDSTSDEMKDKCKNFSYNDFIDTGLRYTVIPIGNDYKKAEKIGIDSVNPGQLCYTQMLGTWEQYTNKGKNKCYALLAKNYKEIPQEHSESLLPQYSDYNGYDEYGLSMIFFFVEPEELGGHITTSNTRWNHEADYPGLVDKALTEWDITCLYGQNFFDVFKGYYAEELKAMGIRIMTPKKAQALLAQGIDPENIFDNVDFYNEGFARVELNNKNSFVDTNNKLIGNGNLWFDCVGYFHDGFAIVKLNDKWSFIDRNGNFIENGNLWFDSGGNFSEGFASVYLKHKGYSFIDTNGNFIGNGNLWFDCTENFCDGLARVKLNYKWSFIDTNGNFIGNGNLWFNWTDSFSDGFARVRLNNKWSLIDTNGELIGNGNLWFDRLGYFNEDFAKVELNNKWSFISSDGELIGNGNLWFDKVYSFYDGFAQVELNNKWSLIDRNGNFYDYNTRKPIPSPFEEPSVSENKKYNFNKMKKYTKNDIRYINLSESNNYKIFNKKNLVLKEEQDAYVEKDGTNDSLSSAISREKVNDPNAKSFKANVSDFDGNPSTDTTEIDVKARNPQDAQSSLKQKLNNTPGLKQAANSGKLVANVKLENKDYAQFTKNQLNKFLKTI